MASLTCCECIFYSRERPFQPAASWADDLPQRTEHLTQEVLAEKTSAHLLPLQPQQRLIGIVNKDNYN